MLKKIIDCGASWCGPCKAMSVTFKKASEKEEYKSIDFVSVDIDTEEGDVYVQKYQVRNIPAIFFLDENDAVLHRINGNVSEDEFFKTIEKYR